MTVVAACAANFFAVAVVCCCCAKRTCLRPDCTILSLFFTSTVLHVLSQASRATRERASLSTVGGGEGVRAGCCCPVNCGKTVCRVMPMLQLRVVQKSEVEIARLHDLLTKEKDRVRELKKVASQQRAADKEQIAALTRDLEVGAPPPPQTQLPILSPHVCSAVGKSPSLSSLSSICCTSWSVLLCGVTSSPPPPPLESQIQRAKESATREMLSLSQLPDPTMSMSLDAPMGVGLLNPVSSSIPRPRGISTMPGSANDQLRSQVLECGMARACGCLGGGGG